MGKWKVFTWTMNIFSGKMQVFQWKMAVFSGKIKRFNVFLFSVEQNRF